MCLSHAATVRIAMNYTPDDTASGAQRIQRRAPFRSSSSRSSRSGDAMKPNRVQNFAASSPMGWVSMARRPDQAAARSAGVQRLVQPIHDVGPVGVHAQGFVQQSGLGGRPERSVFQAEFAWHRRMRAEWHCQNLVRKDCQRLPPHPGFPA